MKRLSLILAFGAVSAWSIDIPRIGFARDSQGTIYRVNGLAGNFVQGDPIAADTAVAFSWNGDFGIRKTDAAVEWWDNTGTRLASMDAPAGDAVIGFGVQTAWIYSKSAHTLSQVKVDQWRLQEVQVSLLPGTDEEVLAVAGGRDTVDVAVRRAEGLFVVTFDQATGSRIADRPLGKSATRVLFLADGAIAGIDGSTIWITQADGSAWGVDAGTPLTGLAWMGREWIQVSGADFEFALRIRSGVDPALYTLPQAVHE